MGVCTNKREDLSRKLLAALGMDRFFGAVVGRDTLSVCKPHPGHVTGTVALAGGELARAVMVGDSSNDAAAARAAGVPAIAVSFGYPDRPVETLGAEPSARGTSIVRTRINRTEEPPVELDYRVRPGRSGEFRIVDVFLNGTVSELALRRSDYSSLMKREGFGSLRKAVEQKIAEAEAGTSDESP